MESSKEFDNESCERDEEDLDPRIKLELEKLNAATDCINHLETEYGEAQALFQQMMQDATFQLKYTHQQLGKCVNKSRPYYEALVQAKLGHSQLHAAALSFEKAQTKHYNAKHRVREAEGKASSNVSKQLDPALIEVLNESTIEVLDASKISEEAWERHRSASIEFENKQKTVNDLYKSLHKLVIKSRPYFDLKMNLNKQLEMQKNRLEKIQEGLQVSKKLYSKTLHNLEVISDDIHKSRELKRKALLEPRGQGVGADSCDKADIEFIRSSMLDNISDTLSFDDTVSTVSCSTNASHMRQLDEDLTSILLEDTQRYTNSNDTLPDSTLSALKSCKGGDSYDVITSQSIPTSPSPLPDFFIDMPDGGFSKCTAPLRRVQSLTDLKTHSIVRIDKVRSISANPL